MLSVRPSSRKEVIMGSTQDDADADLMIDMTEEDREELRRMLSQNE